MRSRSSPPAAAAWWACSHRWCGVVPEPGSLALLAPAWRVSGRGDDAPSAARSSIVSPPDVAQTTGRVDLGVAQFDSCRHDGRQDPPMSLISELKRRNVIRVALLYLVAGWVILQVADLLFECARSCPSGASRLVLGLLLLGFPLALIFSWVYELTPEGLKREHEVERNQSVTAADRAQARRAARGAAGLAVGVLVATARRADARPVSAECPRRLRAQRPPRSGPASIAVLPFVNMSARPESEYFSDGITEELLNVLAQVQRLRVTARTSSFAFKGKNATIAEIAQELNVATCSRAACARRATACASPRS